MSFASIYSILQKKITIQTTKFIMIINQLQLQFFY